MKVVDLRCPHDHRFEGWFASNADLQDQMNTGRVACPLCGDTAVERLPSAPHIGAATTARGQSSGKDEERGTSPAVETPVSAEQSRQAQWLHHWRSVLARVDDVGDRFASEARRMHYGEIEERAIRGCATEPEVKALADEGIEVVSLPVPTALKEPLQ